MVKINGHDFLVGCDPEFFVTKDGKPVSAHALIPGDKKTPFKVKGGAVQVDGMALEFNIDPAKNSEEFVARLDMVMKQILAMVPDHAMYDQPVAEFGFDYIQSQPQEAKVLGCEPDYNAYTGEANPTPNAEMPFRTASGHIHIGWTKNVDPHDPGHFNACRRLTRMLDRRLGVMSLIWDKDKKRRELYGKAGAFRPKPYGMEYRTLSNAWLNPALPHLRKCVYGNTIEAIKELFEDPKADEKMIFGRTARDLVDSSDFEQALFAAQAGTFFTPPKSFR